MPAAPTHPVVGTAAELALACPDPVAAGVSPTYELDSYYGSTTCGNGKCQTLYVPCEYTPKGGQAAHPTKGITP